MDSQPIQKDTLQRNWSGFLSLENCNHHFAGTNQALAPNNNFKEGVIKNMAQEPLTGQTEA